MKNRKISRSLTLILIIILAGYMNGCSSTIEPSNTDIQTQGQDEPSEYVVENLKEPFAEQPALVTSAGMSPDAQIVSTLLERNDIKHNFVQIASEDDLTDVKSLVIVVGGSAKGLGEAGLQAEEELDRCVKLVDVAESKGLSIIGVHSGGDARRGDLTDKFIKAIMPKVDYILVLNTGNTDALFTNIASENKIPLNEVDGLSDVGVTLKEAFK